MSTNTFLRSHLLIAVTITYISGITFSQYSDSSQPILLFLLLTGIAILFSIYLKRQNSAMYLLLVFFAQIGVIAGSHSLTPPTDPHFVVNVVDIQKETIVLGKIKRIYGYDGQKSRFDVVSKSIRTKDSSFQQCSGVVRYTLKAELPQSIIPGSNVVIRAKLKRPGKFLTPGSFDYQRYLALQNIWLTGYISSPLHISIVQTKMSLLEKLTFSGEILRENIKMFIDSNLPKDTAALYKALITGDRSSISPELIEQFKGAGCMHILAISGIHMSLLGLFLFSILYWTLRRSTKLILIINTKKTAALLCIVPLIIYALIAGGQTPVVRSLIMSIIVITAVCSERKHSFYTLVACAALLILVFSPSDLFTASFQLTFAAVISITSIIPALRKINQINETPNYTTGVLHKSRTWLMTGIGVSIAATLGTAPLLIYYFNKVSLIGPFANLIIEPLICFWSLTIGFIATIFIYIFPPIAVLLFKFGAIGLLFATKSVYFFNSFSLSSVRLPTPSIYQICIFYINLILLLNYQLISGRIRLFSIFIFVISLLLFWFPLPEITKYSQKHAIISFLDVGHGSATLVELPQGKRILIDGGALSSPKFNIGERVIAPFLWQKGITKIDDIIITHPDSDHYNGIPFLLKHFGVKKLWINGREEDDYSWQHLLTIANKLAIHIQIPSSETTILCSGDACVRILANTGREFEKGVVTIKNEESLIIKFSYGSFSALFPGDITTNIEKELIQKIGDLQATLLLAAHHGSATSNSKEFLEAISPQYLIISASRFKSDHFPAQGLLASCNELGITILQTAKDGTITVKSTEKDFVIDTVNH